MTASDVPRILVLASANPDKVAELTAVLAEELPHAVIRGRPADLPPVAEHGATLEENARLKAAAVAVATGLPALADDTGLEVVALGGGPGVLTSRYAGPGATYADNVNKLLGALGGVGPGERRARFRTVALLVWPDGTEVAAEGVLDGTIAHERRGAGGFGYDPVFVPDEGDGRTLAELSAPEKNALSHRARAVRALVVPLTSPAGRPPRSL